MPRRRLSRTVLPLSTTAGIPGREVVGHLGLVEGCVVVSLGFTRGMVGNIKAMARGEVAEFSSSLDDAKELARSRMFSHAKRLKADAVVGMRYATAEVGQGLVEFLCYGTAVTLDEEEGSES